MTKPPSAVLIVKSRLIIPTMRPIPAQHKDAAAIRLLENQAQAAELLFLVGAKIAFLAKELAEETRQFVQVFEIAGSMTTSLIAAWLFHNRTRWQCQLSSHRL